MAPNPPTPPRDRSVWRLPRLRIDRDGVWLHEGEEVTHPGILDDLRSNLRVDAEGHYVQGCVLPGDGELGPADQPNSAFLSRSGGTVSVAELAQRDQSITGGQIECLLDPGKTRRHQTCHP